MFLYFVGRTKYMNPLSSIYLTQAISLHPSSLTSKPIIIIFSITSTFPYFHYTFSKPKAVSNYNPLFSLHSNKRIQSINLQPHASYIS